MADLQDYSGRLIPDLDMHMFSKDALVRMWRASAKLYMGMDGCYFTLLREKYGEKTARELSRECWYKYMVALEVRRGREAMNIWGEDVESYLKYIQIDIGAGGVWLDAHCEMKGANRGILTIGRCLGLEYFERHNDTVAQKHACEVLDVVGFEQSAKMFNPRMQCRALKLPPRVSEKDIACEWEFKLEE
jgi:hypothetical protein